MELVELFLHMRLYSFIDSYSRSSTRATHDLTIRTEYTVYATVLVRRTWVPLMASTTVRHCDSVPIGV